MSFHYNFMEETMRKFIVIAIAVLALLVGGCPTDTGSNNSGNTESPKFSQDMWGEWYGLQFGSGKYSSAPWQITQNTISAKFPGASSMYDYTGLVAISRLSENVLKAELYRGAAADGIWLLFPKRVANASFTGKVAGFSEASSSQRSVSGEGLSPRRSVAGGKGFAGVVIEDINTGKTVSTTTDGDGYFTVENAIPGDTYGVTPEGGTTVEVTPNADGDDVGTITINNGLNFKASVTPASDIMLAGGTAYSCSIKIKNVGNQTASACTYTITGPNGEAIDSGILGSLAAGKEKAITFSASCGAISEEKKFKKYDVVVTDPINNKTWNDSVSLLFYKSVITLTVMSGGYVVDPYTNYTYYSDTFLGGVIISPERISYSWVNISSSNNRTINVPRLRGSYLIAIPSALGTSSYLPETVYAIDMSIFSSHLTKDDFKSQVDSFTDTGNYEPNNTEETAAAISAPVISYFHEGDVDYYRVTVE
jgi:hypothetical protein